MTSHNPANVAALDCRKLASFYRTRETGNPMTEAERIGLANLLVGVADLIESASRNPFVQQPNNVISMSQRVTH